MTAATKQVRPKPSQTSVELGPPQREHKQDAEFWTAILIQVKECPHVCVVLSVSPCLVHPSRADFVYISQKTFMTENSAKPMMVLIAGPYRSGTNDDPALIQRNVQEMESYALPIFRAGHIPILGEWLALPLVELAGSRKIGDEPFNEIFHPIATRLLEKCDAVLRVGGRSAGADEMVRVGRGLGLKIYTTVEEIPPSVT